MYPRSSARSWASAQPAPKSTITAPNRVVMLNRLAHLRSSKRTRWDKDQVEPMEACSSGKWPNLSATTQELAAVGGRRASRRHRRCSLKVVGPKPQPAISNPFDTRGAMTPVDDKIIDLYHTRLTAVRFQESVSPQFKTCFGTGCAGYC